MKLATNGTSTVRAPRKEIVQVGPTMFVGIPMTGRRVSGVGKKISKTSQMRAFAKLV